MQMSKCKSSEAEVKNAKVWEAKVTKPYIIPNLNLTFRTLRGQQRTNNSVEAWHLHIGSKLAACRGDFTKYINVLKAKRTRINTKFVQANAGAKQPAKRPKLVQRNQRIKKLVSSYDNKKKFLFLYNVAANSDVVL